MGIGDVGIRHDAYTKSDFQATQATLENFKCKDCKGHGHVDDAEPGDIGFNVYICTPCRGTGFKNGVVPSLDSLISSVVRAQQR